MRKEFIEAVKKYQPKFSLDLPEETIEKLATHYEVIMEHNPILHLVGPSSVEEFVVRHVLESLLMLDYMPPNAKFADIGPGGGFPAIPCLIVRERMSAVLIESSLKKAAFLREVLAKCGLEDRVEIVNQQFSEVRRPYVLYVSCRALDKFAKKLPAILKWSGDCNLLFYGGPALGDELQKLKVEFKPRLMPMSDQRYLFVAEGRERSANAEERITKPQAAKPRTAEQRSVPSRNAKPQLNDKRGARPGGAGSGGSRPPRRKDRTGK